MDSAVVSAINTAWPGTSTYARFRRRVAIELVATPNGPLGPHTALSAKLSSVMRAKHAALAAEACDLCTPQDGRLRLKQLLARGPGPSDKHGMGAEDTVGGAFLYWTPHTYDLCLVLKLDALLQWLNSGSPTGPTTPLNDAQPTADSESRPGFGHVPRGPFGAGPGTLGSRPPLPHRGGHGVHIDLSGLVPRYGTRGADKESPYCRPPTSGDAATDAAHPGTYHHQHQHHQKGDGGGSGDVIGTELVVGGNGTQALVDLSYMAFPGAHPASQLRRRLVGCLATGEAEGGGLPRHTVPWRQVAPLVSSSRAAAMCPSLSTPAFFKSFLLHPASAGAFAATRILRDPSNPVSNVDCVSLSPAALHRAAASGVSAAIAAAWPGDEPLQQLKRATAEVLSRAWTSAGSYSLNAGPLGNELRKRKPTLYAFMRGAPGSLSGGLTQRLDESGTPGGFLVYVREEAKEGYLHLKLHALLREFPKDEGRDLGLEAHGGQDTPAAAAAAAFGASSSSSSMIASSTGALANGGSGRGSSSGALAQQGSTATTTAPAPVTPPITSPVTGGAAAMYPSPPEQPVSAPPVNATSAAVAPLPLDSSPVAGDVNDPWVGSAQSPQQPDASWPKQQSGFIMPPPFETGASATSSLKTASAALTDAAAVGGSGVDNSNVAQSYTAAHVAQYIPQPLTESAVQWVRHSTEFNAMMQHCFSVPSIGLAVHTTGGMPLVAALYAPACAAAETAVDSSGAPVYSPAWPATVYLFECVLVLATSEDGSTAEGALPGAAEALRALLESPYIAKVVHGCQQVVSLATTCGASTISPLLDNRLLLQAVISLLPPLLPLPPRPPGYGAVGPLAAVALAKLNAHTAGLRDELVKTGLWAERGDLLAAVLARQTAALREDLFGAPAWSSNPTVNETSLVAAARHLPEIWEALSYEAVPWVAMAAAANATAAALEASRAGSTGGSVPSSSSVAVGTAVIVSPVTVPAAPGTAV